MKCLGREKMRGVFKGKVTWCLWSQNSDSEKGCHITATGPNTQLKGAVYRGAHLPLNTFISSFCGPIPSRTQPNLLTHKVTFFPGDGLGGCLLSQSALLVGDAVLMSTWGRCHLCIDSHPRAPCLLLPELFEAQTQECDCLMVSTGGVQSSL